MSARLALALGLAAAAALLVAVGAAAQECETQGTGETCPLRDDLEGDGVFNEFGAGADIGNVWVSRDDGAMNFTIDLRVFEEGETPSVCCASESAYMVQFNHTSDITGNRTHYAVAAVRYAGEGYNATGGVFEQYFLYVKPTDSPRWAWCRLQEVEGERSQLDRWGFRYRFTLNYADLDVETPPQRLANLTQQYQHGLFSPYMSCDPPMRGPAAQYGERLTGFGAKYRVNPVGNTEAPDPVNHLGEGVELPGGFDVPNPHEHGLADSCPYFWPERPNGDGVPVGPYNYNPLDDTCDMLPEDVTVPPIFPLPYPMPFIGDYSNGTMMASLPYVLGAPPPDLKVDAAGTEAAIELGFYHTTAGYPITVEPLVWDGQETYECEWDEDIPGTFGEPGLCRTTVVFAEPGWYTIRVNVTDGIDAVSDTAGVLVDPLPPEPTKPGTPTMGGGEGVPTHADSLGGGAATDECPANRFDACVWDSSGDGIPDRVRHCPVLKHPGCDVEHEEPIGPAPQPDAALVGQRESAGSTPEGLRLLESDDGRSLQTSAVAWSLGSAAAMLLLTLLGAMLFVLLRSRQEGR